MADIDEVNAQHLASMGLAEEPLGSTYQATNEPAKAGTRCVSVSEHGRCIMRPGHDGKHVRGTARWSDTEPVEQFTYTGWAEVPWVRGCDTCFRLSQGPEKIGTLIAHMHLHGLKVPEPTKQREGDQVLPTGGGDCVQDRVIADMEESKRVGLERYGSVLRTFNGRRSITDVHEEVRDLFVYLTQVRMESEADREALIDVVDKAVHEVVWGPDSPYIGQKPIEKRLNRPLAEAAVDSIMGWVTGHAAGGFASQEDLYHFLDEAWPVTGGCAQILECLTHSLGDRLGIEAAQS